MNREFLMLAHVYKPAKYDVAGWYLSEKLDGFRAFWDGGVSRGVPTRDVPWAGTIDPKTHNEKSRIKPVATGLWSRYGNPIMAPDWFLNQLPPLMLDGELWAGRGGFQRCRSICAVDVPNDAAWHTIDYAVFSTPHPANFAFEGIIKNPNMYLPMNSDDIMRWIQRRNIELGGCFMRVQDGSDFEEELACLRDTFGDNEHIYLHRQRKLPMVGVDEAINTALNGILDDGGEGVMVRDPTSQWEPRRVRTMLKYKPFSDAEATITGFTTGRRTDKGSKLLGKIGALIVDYEGKRLELSGLTDVEREFDAKYTEWAKHNPGEDAPSGAKAIHFKVGQTITFKYRELSDSQVPKEARFWRKRDTE